MAKFCKMCGEKIASHSSTGFCRKHYQDNAADKKCEKCDIKLKFSNQSGLCKKHRYKKYNENKEYKERALIRSKEYAKKYKEKHREKSKLWQKNNPERTKQIRLKTMSGPNNRFTRSRHTAEKRRGLDWGIEKSKYYELIKNTCHYCHSGLDTCGIGLDRLDNDRGYTLDNVVPCCGDCNKIRGDRLTSEEMKVAMKAVLSFRNKNFLVLVNNG